MSKPATSAGLKSGVFRVLCAAALAALIATCSAGIADAGSRLWSVVVHIEYANGTVYEHAFATGVPTSDLPSILEACGSAHRGGSAVQYHCYPVPE